MVSEVMTLTVEMDVLGDAITELHKAHGVLARRHGADFRALDRRIARLMENPEDIVAMHTLKGGAVLAAPSGELTEILHAARLLGVLAR